MHADEFEDALRFVTGSGRGTADVFREGTLDGKWRGVRAGLRQMLKALEQDIANAPQLNQLSEKHGIKTRFASAKGALNSAESSVTETEIAYRVACALAYILKATLKESIDK